MAYGTVNADVIGTSVAGSNLGAGNASIMKNRIINGAMIINQRGFSGSNSNSTYTLDRWVMITDLDSKFTVAQSSTAPTGFNNSLLVTSSSAYSVPTGGFYTIAQYIEGYNAADLGWGTANAKTVTLSFQVYSSLTGTFGGALRNSANDRSYPFTYTVSAANTWTTASVTIAGDTSGTWLTTNGKGITVIFGLGVGATYSGTAGSWAGANYVSATGAISVVGTNGATFYITGVQLEVGSSATGFEYRQYQQELALCQRYCINYRSADSDGSYLRFGYGEVINSTTLQAKLQLFVPMRITPSVTVSSNASQFAAYSNDTITNCNAAISLSSQANSPLVLVVNVPVASGLTGGRAGSLLAQGNQSCFITLSAEL